MRSDRTARTSSSIFDKETELPLKLTARVADFDGNEYLQEASFSDYKEIGGIMKATKIEVTRDGQRFQQHQLTDFTILGKIDPKTFTK